MAGKKVHKLDLSIENEYYLFGISSHENDYRLCWGINNIMNIELAKSQSLKVQNKKIPGEQEFSIFSFEDDTRMVKYNLISNRCENGFFLEEFRNIDFVLQIIGSVSGGRKDEIQNLIKSISFVTLIFEIDINNLKSKNKFALTF